MSSSKLGQLAENIVAQIQEDANKRLRRELTRKVEGQILVIISRRFNTIIEELFPDITKATLKKIADKYETKIRSTLETGFLSSIKEKAEKKRFLDAKKKLDNRQRRTFIIRTYRDFEEGRGSWKGRKKELNDLIIEHHLENKVSKADEKQLDKTSGRDNVFGSQLGHAEGNEGLAVSAISAAKAKSTVAAFKGDTTLFDEAIERYENKLKVVIDHTQIIQNGKLKKEYIPSIFLQKAATNQEMKDLEAAAIAQLEKDLQDIATLKGSTTLLQATSMILLDASAGKQRSQGARKKNIKEKSKGTANTVLKTQKRIPRASSSGVDAKAAASLKKKGRGSQPQFSPFNLASIINEKLPQVVQKNMRSPRLQNQSGRLARSVKITDVMQTKQGFLSFGYSYQKDPYQVYEMGEGSAPWANPQRDPRRLIDKSIREVAANMALGRFYTRRM